MPLPAVLSAFAVKMTTLSGRAGVFDEGRTSYLYNLDRYDAVILVTDKAGEAGLQDLSAVLQVHGCGKQFLVGGGG